MHAYKKYLKTMALVWAGALMLFIAAFSLLLNPQIKEKKRLVAEAADKQKLYAGAADAAREDTRKKIISELETLKSKMNDYAIDSKDSANITLDISRIAAAKQVSSFTIKTSDQHKSSKTESKYLRENQINISFNANFRQFATLLNTLERHRPIVFVDSFRIARSNEDNRIDMELSIFVRKRPEG
jgi:Tfp pilus assembly protein PilO